MRAGNGVGAGTEDLFGREGVDLDPCWGCDVQIRVFVGDLEADRVGL